MNIHERIEDAVRGFDGVISLCARDLKTRRSFQYHPDRKCSTASVIKFPILVHALLLVEEGKLSLDEKVTLRQEDKRPGSGVLKDLSAGLELTLRDACMLMIAVSDNTATNLVIDRVGIDETTDRMRSLGLPNTKLFRKVFSTGPAVNAENRRYGLGVTTPAESLKLLVDSQRGKIGGVEFAVKVRHFLAAQHYRSGIPRYLPASYGFAGKSGAVDRVRNDVGIVTVEPGHEIALAIFVQKLGVVQWTEDNPGLLKIAELSRLLVDYFVSGSA